MYVTYDRMILGGTPVPWDGTLQWTSGSFDDVDSVDPSNLSIEWSLEANADEWIVRRGDTDGDRVITLDDTETMIHGDFRATGAHRDVDIHDTTVRLSDLSDDNTIEFRHTSSDHDQIIEFERYGASDWDLNVYQDGVPERVYTTGDDDIDAGSIDGNDASQVAILDENETVGGDWNVTGTLQNGLAVSGEVSADSVSAGSASFDSADIGGAQVLSTASDYDPTVENDGAVVDENVHTFNFGNDLGVTDDDGGVTVDFVGATIPARIYEDGTEVLADANGLDFISDFTIGVGTDDVAEVELDIPDDLASTSDDETFTGNVTFENRITGSIDHAVDADTATNADSATSADHATSADSADHATDADHALDADNFAGAGPDAYAVLDADETVTGNYLYDGRATFSSGTELAFGNNDEFRMWYSTSSETFVMEEHTGGSASSVFSFDGDNVEFAANIHEDGNRVSTRAYTDTEIDSHASDFSAHHAKTTSLDEIDDCDATEIVISSTEPAGGENTVWIEIE